MQNDGLPNVSDRPVVYKLLRTIFLLVILFFPSLGTCLNYSPWLGEMLVFDWQNSLLYQTYPCVSSGNHNENISGDDFFFTTDLSSSYQQFGLELEVTEAFTRKQHGTIDNLGITFKYVWLDDVAGDPFSLTTGVSLIKAFRRSVNDISSFHHGQVESEIFISVGKETACLEEWIRRWSSTFALGLADKGSPWLRFNWEYDFKAPEEHEWKLFCQSLFGLGGRDLHGCHFRGYGSIEHQSVELGFKYTYIIDFVGKVSFQYSNRVYAKNFPSRVNLFIIEFLYDFGIDSLGFIHF